MEEHFANEILQWCGKVWNWGNQNGQNNPHNYMGSLMLVQSCDVMHALAACPGCTKKAT